MPPSAFQAMKKTPSIGKQLEAISPPKEGHHLQLSDLPQLRRGRYILTLEKWVHRQVPRRSWVFDYGYALVLLTPHKCYRTGTTFWLCRACDKKNDTKHGLFLTKHATSSCAKHLKQAHLITPSGEAIPEPALPSSQTTMEQAFANTPPAPIAAASVAGFRDCLIDWVVSNGIPLNVVSHSQFRMLLSTHSEIIRSALPHSSSTMKEWLLSRFATKKALIQRQLHNTISLISFSFDLWTSPNGHAILGVLAHYISVEWLPVTRVLAFRKLEGSHSGENMALAFGQVCDDYEIQPHQIGFFTLDNIESNTTCVTCILRRRAVHSLPGPIEKEVPKRRLRCWGHIINLVAKAFLFGTQNPSRASSIYSNNYEEAWRALGSVGKLHNVVQFVRRSPQRRELWSRIVDEIRVTADDKDLEDISSNIQLRPDQQTRWNSTFNMVERAIRLRPVVDEFCMRSAGDADPSRRLPEKDMLYPSDWANLGEVTSILRPFRIETKRFEGYTEGMIAYIMPSYLKLYRHLSDYYTRLSEPTAPPASQNQSQQNSLLFHSSGMGNLASSEGINSRPDHQLCEAVKLAMTKLYDYGSKLGATPVYWSALILHPGMRLSYVSYMLNDEIKVEAIRNQFVAFYEERWALAGAGDHSHLYSSSGSSHGEDEDLIPRAFYKSHGKMAGGPVNELETYLSERAYEIEDGPLQWWKQYEATYPTLSRMARDILCIPPESADVERLFSKARIMMSDQRHSLNETTMEAIQCLGSWP